MLLPPETSLSTYEEYSVGIVMLFAEPDHGINVTLFSINICFVSLLYDIGKCLVVARWQWDSITQSDVQPTLIDIPSIDYLNLLNLTSFYTWMLAQSNHYNSFF